jgi:UDP-glucose 4-epimerase
MNYLITGGAGFIGSHLAEKLIARGDQVTIFDNFSTGLNSSIAGFKNLINVEIGSVLDKSKVSKLVKNTDHVIHLAAALGVFNIVNKPL